MSEQVADAANAPQTAGDILIQEVRLIDRNNNEIDIQALMIELNIFEDIFSNTLYGNILVNDGLSLIEKLPIIGEEYIRIRLQTPGWPDEDNIFKTFRIYHISDRKIVKSDRTQQYILHFVSSEAIIDTLFPISKTFGGPVDSTIAYIFDKYLNMPRNLFGKTEDQEAHESEDTTPLYIIDETKNSITFTSPRWTPLKCINWLAARSIPKESAGCNQLFFETNKAFVFGSIEQLIKRQIEQELIAEHYIYAPNNIRGSSRDSNFNYKKQDIMKEYRIVESFTIENNFNTLQNLQNGHYANRLYKFDVINKDYQWFDFDYVAQYGDYSHLETTGTREGGPFFTPSTIRNPEAKIMFYPTHPELYTDVRDNANDIIENTLQNRMSLLNDLDNYKITAVVPGRTDMEVGSVVRFDFPSVGPKDENTSMEDAIDKYLGGLYLITAIRHKVTQNKHMMYLELIKDSAKRILGE